MATIPVIIQIKDFSEREVHKVSYEFEQATDKQGQNTGIPRGGKIRVRVKALNNGSPELLSWMLEPHMAKDVTISFYETKTGKLMKQIEITGAYCVDYVEDWADGNLHYEEFVMSCQHIKFGNVVFDNQWA